MEKSIHVTTFKGVKIFREYTEMLNLKEMKDGSVKELKPSHATAFRYADSYPYTTLKECKEAITGIYERCTEVGIDEKVIIEIMNEELE